MTNTELIRQEIERRIEILTNVYAQQLERNDEEMATYYHGKIVALEELGSFIDSLQQEQSEVDLEKFTEKIKTFQGRYKYPEIVSIKGAMAFMARMFCQYPNTARQWYEQLPKVTMD